MSGDPLPVLSDLTPPELELLDSAQRGVTAQLSRLPVHLVAVSAPQVRGPFIRELLLGRRGDLDPRGVRLAGARITGDLDLAHVRAKAGLSLTRCTIVGSFNAVDARIENLTCVNCRIDHLHADRVRIENVLDLKRTQVTTKGPYSAIRLSGAHIGTLDCTALEVHSGSDPAIEADRLHIEGDLSLERARVFSSAAQSAVSLLHAGIGGYLSGVGMRIANTSGPAVRADGMQVGSGMSFATAQFTGTGRRGALRLPGTKIGGEAQCSGLRVTNSSGPAVAADNMQTGGNLFLSNARIAGAGEAAALRIDGAQIGGQFNGQGLNVDNRSGPAIVASGMTVHASLNLPAARVSGTGRDGALRLLEASVGHQFMATGVRVVNRTGPGLVADGLEVKGNFFLKDAEVVGAGPLGAVRLVGARIDRQLICTGARISNRSGPGFSADTLVVGNSLSFKGSRIDGTGEQGALRLHSAVVARQLDFAAHRIRNSRGVAIDLTNAQAGSHVFLPHRLICPQAWGRSCRWPAGVRLDNFTFGALANLSWREWLHLIRFHTPQYTPSPYQKLAAAERAAGHDGNARHILIAQQQDLQRRDADAVGGRLTRFFHRSWGVLAGYGYRARRTAAALALALLAAVGVGLVAGHITDGAHHAAERVTSFALPTGQPCTTVELIGVGLDRGLPLSPTGVRTRCDLNTETTAGQWLTLLIWLIQAAVWGLATLALAGYTGLIRKPA